MLIDRGIDVCLLTKARYEIVAIRSHVDDADAKGTIFSRDCAEYVVRTPTGKRLVLLVTGAHRCSVCSRDRCLLELCGDVVAATVVLAAAELG